MTTGKRRKRIVALLMAFCIALTAFSPAGIVTAHAANTELVPEDLPLNGGGTTTAYKWLYASAFDMQGIKDGTLVGSEAPYNGSGIKTTYNNAGYESYYGIRSQNGSIRAISIDERAAGTDNGGIFVDGGLEIQIKVYPSQDEKWVMVEYIVYNKTNNTIRNVNIGSLADVQIGNDDYAPLYRTDKGIRMTNKNTLETFELITNSEELGLSNGKYDSAMNPEGIRTWMYNYWYRHDNIFEHSTLDYFDASVDTSRDRPGDSGITYSWEFDLNPYETVTRTVAFGVRGPSYYVSAASGVDATNRSGSYDQPFKTIEYAINKLSRNQLGYIYIQDYGDITSTILVNGEKNITFSSADYDQAGNPVDDIKTLKRAAAFNSGPMFKASGNSTIRFSNIVLDGNKDAVTNNNYPLVSADSGLIALQANALLTNNQVNSNNIGSAIDISGTAGLDMNYGDITGNVSGAAGRGAVHFNGSKAFTVRNEVNIIGNTSADGVTPANVYLPEGKTITINDTLDGQIGVSTENLPPALNPDTAVPQGHQVIPIVASDNEHSVDDPTFYVENFVPDAQSATGVYVTGYSVGSKNDVVLRRDGKELMMEYLDDEETTILEGDIKFYGSGDSVTEIAPDLSGYVLEEIRITDPSGSGALQAEYTTDSDGAVVGGKISGRMPAADVQIAYRYRRIPATIYFYANGANQSPAPIPGMAGEEVQDVLPNVTKYGYYFGGWYDNPEFNGSPVTKLPAVFPMEAVSYHAKWIPNTDYLFNFSVKYQNQRGDIIFQNVTDARPAEADIQAQIRHIPSYTLIGTDVTPTDYDNRKVGVFDSSHTFTGNMANQDVLVRYIYGVDRTAGNDNELKIIHRTSQGTLLGGEAAGYFPEEAIEAKPMDIYGYQVSGWEVTSGHQADEDNMIYAVTGSFFADGTYQGKMPNQAVEIVYTYEASGAGFDYTVKYLYGDKNIRTSLVESKLPDAVLETPFTPIYGYVYEDAKVNPAGAGTFGLDHSFTGIMPSDDTEVIYQYEKDAGKWAALTYKADTNGYLSAAGLSEEVVAGAVPGTYETSVIRNDGTAEGLEGSYTWGEIKARNLVPEAIADDYYLVLGWYLADSNGEFTKELTDDYRFEGDETVMARFRENPEWWIDIHFAAGQRGSLAAGAHTFLHTTKDKTWADIQGANELPAVVPDINYLVDGWYLDEHLMTGTEILEDGKTYTIRFERDPNVFGTDVQTPDAEGRVDQNGSGKITVFGTTAEFQYLVADLDGTILAVQDGSDLSSRLTFTGNSPGSRYLVYEAYKSVTVMPGDNGNGLSGVSVPQEVLIPVIESNYYITYDDNDDGLAKLVINPADADTDYALLDRNGDVIHTSKTDQEGWLTPSGKNPSQAEFGGLQFNQEYLVVGRPKDKAGVLPADKTNEGTVILTDISGELEIPYYIIEAIGGTVVSVGEKELDTERYEFAEEDDLVRLSAPQTNSDGGTFRHWQIIIGQVHGISGIISHREVEFEMPDANIVAYAHYSRTDSNANVEEEVRGGNENELAVDPGDIPDLRETLTTDEDRDLIDINDADVTYKVVFNKNRANSREEKAIQESPEYLADYADHEKAFKAAWGLDITIERYVNGRKVEMASPSNASFQVIAQLDKSDVDMLDYQLYEIEDDGYGNLTASLVPFEDGDPEENGGLFRFKAEAGHRYVLAYSRAHRVTFLNDTKSRRYPDFPDIFYLNFKVRRYGNVLEPYYVGQFYHDDNPVLELIDNDGVKHWYIGWSTRNMPGSYKPFALESEILTKTNIYGYYENNWLAVWNKRLELEQAIKDAAELSREYFLTRAEADEIITDIAAAQEVYDQVDRKATLEELQEALDKLQWSFDRTKEIVDDRNQEYEDKHTNGNSSHGGGGTGSGGGSGAGTVRNPYISKPSNSYVVGTNGNWELRDADGHQWSFVLNGGIPLRSMWAYLEYTDGDLSRTGWYYFGQDGVMKDGWFRDEAMNWYYCNTAHDGWYGKMKTGWHKDETDGYYYYLDEESGGFTIGWKEIEGKWYYFNTYNNQNTYSYNTVTGKWEYVNRDELPLGSLFVSARTPDGYLVDENGAWIE